MVVVDNGCGDDDNDDDDGSGGGGGGVVGPLEVSLNVIVVFRFVTRWRWVS